MSYKAARIEVSPKSPFAICSFAGATSHAEAVRQGSALLEEGLDMLSMGRAIDVVTRDAADEYFAWWVDSQGRVIAAVDTSTSTFSAKFSMSGAASAPQPAPLHHPGLRFFRLSQVSEDLFEAFRNIYLAFELFLSARYSKTQRFESKWLQDSLSAASGDILLTDLAPQGHPAPVEFVINTIYNDARLPLFHAKDGKVYFVPSKVYFVPSPDEQDRATVKAALAVLTIIVIRMADAWHGIRRPRTGLSSSARDAMIKAGFANASFVASPDARFSPIDPLSSPSITSGISFPAQISDIFDGARRMNIWGAIDTAALKSIGHIEMLHLVNAESPLTSQTFHAPLNVDGFDRFQAVQFSRILGAGEPRIFYSR